MPCLPMADVGRTERRPEYAALAEALRAHLAAAHGVPRPGARTVVGVAGESGSGKSVTAASLARAYQAASVPALVLHQDDYFHRPPRANHAHRLQDIGSVGPQEVDLARLAAHVGAFRAGARGVVGPVANYAEDRFDARPLALAGAALLIVEGTYALTLADLDVRVFLSATHADTAARRRARARDVDDPFVDRVLAIEHRIIARQAAVADVVIDRDFRIVGRGPGA